MSAARSARPRVRGRHLLRPRTAADLAVSSGVDPSHHVVEWGARTGVLTAELAARAGSIEAIELDQSLAHRLRERFADVPHVSVVEADALTHPLPRQPFRVVANIPFHLTSRLLRRLLDDQCPPLLRADLVVQWGAARKRTATNLSSLRWAPWFDVRIARRLPSAAFRPPPSVDAAVLVCARRRTPLVADHARWVSMLEHAYARADHPLPDARRAGLGTGVRAVDLDLEGWLRVYALRAGQRTSSRARGT